MRETSGRFSVRSAVRALRSRLSVATARVHLFRPRDERPLWIDPETEAIAVPPHLSPQAEEAVEEQKHERTRREFLALICAGFGGAITIMVAVPWVGALLAPLTRKTPPEWRSVGKVSDFTIGNTTLVSFTDSSPLEWSGITANTAAWLRREANDQFLAFSINCTHLGCPVRWFQDAQLFMCPCHGGVYYSNGNVASGPPLHSLFLYPVRIENGDVQIQTSAVPIV